jgi:hypothetical protein
MYDEEPNDHPNNGIGRGFISSFAGLVWPNNAAEGAGIDPSIASASTALLIIWLFKPL